MVQWNEGVTHSLPRNGCFDEIEKKHKRRVTELSKVPIIHPETRMNFLCTVILEVIGFVVRIEEFFAAETKLLSEESFRDSISLNRDEERWIVRRVRGFRGTVATVLSKVVMMGFSLVWVGVFLFSTLEMPVLNENYLMAKEKKRWNQEIGQWWIWRIFLRVKNQRCSWGKWMEGAPKLWGRSAAWDSLPYWTYPSSNETHVELCSNFQLHFSRADGALRQS